MDRKQNFFISLRYALQGVIFCITNERHMRFHIFAAIIVIFAGFRLDITGLEWCLLLISITLVLATEMINTAIEKTVDLKCSEFHPLAAVAKNVAAGTVLLAALNAVIIGVVIFLKRF